MARISSPRPKGPGWRIVAVVIFLAQLSWVVAPGAALAAPEQDLRDGAEAYDQSKFKQTIQIIRPLLYPRIILSTPEQVTQAYKILGISYMFEKQIKQAEEQFMAILSLKPDFALDPLVDPKAAGKFLAQVKKMNAEKIQKIMERERQEAERRRKDELRRAEEERRARLTSKPNQIIEKTIVKHPYWINFVPFGGGQFQNEHRGKGYLLMGAQLATGAVSLAMALSYRVAYPDGRVPVEEAGRAQGIRITQVVSGGLFLGLVAYGVIDALVYHQPQKIRERRYKKRGDLTISFTPTLSPETAGVGLSLSY